MEFLHASAVYICMHETPPRPFCGSQIEVCFSSDFCPGGVRPMWNEQTLSSVRSSSYTHIFPLKQRDRCSSSTSMHGIVVRIGRYSAGFAGIPVNVAEQSKNVYHSQRTKNSTESILLAFKRKMKNMAFWMAFRLCE